MKNEQSFIFVHICWVVLMEMLFYFLILLQRQNGQVSNIYLTTKSFLFLILLLKLLFSSVKGWLSGVDSITLIFGLKIGQIIKKG